MKVRIKDNSLRFRLLRGEVKSLAETGRIEASTFFHPADPADRLRYIVEHAEHIAQIHAARFGGEIRIVVPSPQILQWAHGESVGVYGEQPVYGEQMLSIAIEKDFACIDGSEADNVDTFDNPSASAC
jgi:hypothetical protein